MKLLPWSWRSARPRAAPALRWPNCWAHRHAEGLDRLVAGAVFCHVPAEQLGIPVLGDAEQPDLAVRDGGDLGGVGRPHDVRRLGDDVPLMRGLRPPAGAVW